LLFLARLTGQWILDLGSGPGRDAAFFRMNGYAPVCIDLSPAMARLCREKNLDALVMDFEHLAFQPGSFNGVWAYTSLLHLPKKSIQPALESIRRVLRPEGAFYIGMGEGEFEGFREDDRFPGHRRFLSLYRDQELRPILERHFTVIHASQTAIDEKKVYLNYLCTARK